LGAAAEVPEFLRCADHGEALLAEVAAAGLVPDWIEVGPNGWRPAPDHSAHSGYDALRTALFLISSGQHQHPAVQRAATLYAASDTLIPTVADIAGRTILESSDLPGYAALASLVLCANGIQSRTVTTRFVPPQPYYPATLQQFCKIAARSAGLDCERT
jgi:endoglucanase